MACLISTLSISDELDSIKMDKNVEVIFFMYDESDKLVGINNNTASMLEMYLENQQITGLKFIKKVPGKIYPPSEFPENARKFPGFNWRGDERLFTKEDLFKGKELPILPKIQGIPLPEDEGNFFEDIPEDEIELPKDSKLQPKDLQNRETDPKPKTLEDPEGDGETEKSGLIKKEN